MNRLVAHAFLPVLHSQECMSHQILEPLLRGTNTKNLTTDYTDNTDEENQHILLSFIRVIRVIRG
jgi:hypothetical protein